MPFFCFLLALFPAIFSHSQKAAPPIENMLGSTNWVSASSGWGTIHKNQTIVGNRITVNKHVYQTGVGTHANSTITYNLAGSCSSFQSDIGVDDEEGTNGTVVFQVFGDGKKLYESPTMRGGATHKKIAVNVTGVKTALLVVTDAGDNINFDHADWAGGKFLCSKKISGNGTGGGVKSMAWKSGYWYGSGFGGATPPFSDYTHVLYESISPNGGAGIDTSPANLSELDTFVANAHAAGTKALICLGVADAGSWQGSTNSGNVSGFASAVASFVAAHNLDGVDLDWESGIIDSQYADFIQRLRTALGSTKVISMAAYGGGTGNPKRSAILAGVSNIDQINMMTYDQDIYESQTWFETAVLKGPDNRTSIQTAFEEFTGDGIPASKLGIGIPFYGSRYNGASGPNQSRSYGGFIAYSNINPSGSVLNSTYQGTGVGSNPWITFVGPAEINAIINYGTSVGIGGYMTFPINWEDNANTLSNALNTAVGGGGTPFPVISSFTAASPTITSGSSTTLSYSVSGATSVSIDHGIGTVTGGSATTGALTATTTFTLTATNSSGPSTATVTVTVSGSGVPPAPVVTSFTATPSDVTAGGTVTLAWVTSGATSLSIDNGVGTVTGSSTTVTVSANTTFHLTATNGTGSTIVPASVSTFVLGFAPSSNPSYAGVLHRSMIRVDWETTPAKTVVVWKNFGTSLAQQISGSSTTGPQSAWVRDVANGDIFSLVDHATGSVIASFTETVAQISASFSGSFSPWNYPAWQASHSYPVGSVILDTNGNLEVALGGSTGTSNSSAPVWSLTGQVAGIDPPTTDGSVNWFQSGLPTAREVLTGTLAWTVTGFPTSLTTAEGLPDSVGLWTSSAYIGDALLWPNLYDPPVSPLVGNSNPPFPFTTPNASEVNFIGPVIPSEIGVDVGIFNSYGPDVSVGWVEPGSRFYLNWASLDAIAAVAAFADAGRYFVAAYTDAPNPFVTSFVADPATILTFGTNTGTTTLKWDTAFAKVVILYGDPQFPYVHTIPTNGSGQGNLVAAVDHRAKPIGVGQTFWEVTLNGWVPDGALFILYDASTWNIVDFTDASNFLVPLSNYARATVTVSVKQNVTQLSLVPNPISAASGSGSATLYWNAPDSTSVVIRQDNAVTGAILASGGATGSVSLTGLVNGTFFYLTDGTTHDLLRAISATVGLSDALLAASPNPVPVTGRSYSTTLSWSSSLSPVAIRADDPLSGTLVLSGGGGSGTHAIDQNMILNGRVFFLTDATGNVLSQAVVTLLYNGNLQTLFGLPIPDSIATLTAPTTVAPVFPVDPDYAFQKSREWKTNVIEFAPNLTKQSYILHEVPEISFDIGLAVQQGSLQASASTVSKFRKIYAFYRQQKGSALPFYFFDPILWGGADYTPVNYREDPTKRPSSPGTGANPVATTGRYIMRFAEDNLNFERFALLLVKSQLKLNGLAG